MYGFSRASELIGARLLDFLPRTEANVAYLREFVRRGYRLTDGESAERDREGHPKFFLNNLLGVVEAGRLTRAWGTQRDITDRKIQEQERERLLGALKDTVAERDAVVAERDAVVAQLDAIFAQAPFGLALFDDQFRYVRVNRALAEMNGLPAEEHVGRTPEEILPGIPAPLLRQAWERVSGEGEPLVRLELSGETPARPGAIRHWLADWYPVQVRGRTMGIGVLVQEVTESRRLQEEREKAYRGAQDAIRLRDEFLSIAGHELKTPLTALQLQMETISSRAAPLANADLDFWLQRANRSLRRILRLVADLLDVTRIAAGRLRLEPEELDLVERVRGVIARWEIESLRSRSVISLTAPVPVIGWWDAGRVDQIADNLISNAIKYGRGRPISVDVAGDERAARLSVRDEGVGIAEEDQARIFERFERVLPGGHVAGLGLGLWIAREAAKSMGGTIILAGGRDGGSEFRVDLPLRIPDAALRATAG